jgi:hypothetical protein
MLAGKSWFFGVYGRYELRLQVDSTFEHLDDNFGNYSSQSSSNWTSSSQTTFPAETHPKSNCNRQSIDFDHLSSLFRSAL